MTQRSRTVSIACGIGLLALTAAALPSSARAQSADLVLCDRLAADPADPDKPKDVKGTRRDRSVRYRNRDQVLQSRVGVVAARALSARPRLRRQSATAGRRRRLSQGGRQGQHVGHGRARRAAGDRVGRRQGRSPGAQAVRARRRCRQPARRHQSGGAVRQRRARRRIRSRREPCWRERRRRARPRRSISSA